MNFQNLILKSRYFYDFSFIYKLYHFFHYEVLAYFKKRIWVKMTKWENRRKNSDMNNSELDDDISYNRTLEYIASLRVDNTIGNEFVDAIKQGYDSKIFAKLWLQEFLSDRLFFIRKQKISWLVSAHTAGETSPRLIKFSTNSFINR